MSGRSSNQRWLDLERDRQRDQEVLRLRAEGLSYAKIAERVGVSPARVGQLLQRLKFEGKAQ